MKKYHAKVEQISEGVHSFFQKTFNSVIMEGPKIDSNVLQNASIIISCTHRSQADYFIIGQVAHDMGIHNLRFAAGENLTKLPFIGKRFKALGAFSIKRGNTFSRTYLRNLTEQVVKMLQEGDSIIVFPEGGRSYKGHMMELKGGVVGAGALSRLRHPDRKVVYLPVAISYERLPELSYFGALLYGKNLLKDKKNFLKKILGMGFYFGADILAFSKFLSAPHRGKEYKDVYIDYGKPILVDTITDIEKDRNPSARDDFSSIRPSVHKINEFLFKKMAELYRILPMHILSKVLRERGSLSTKGAAEYCSEEVALLKEMSRNLKSIISLSPDQLVHKGIEELLSAHAIKVKNDRIIIRKPWILKYYASTLTEE